MNNLIIELSQSPLIDYVNKFNLNRSIYDDCLEKLSRNPDSANILMNRMKKIHLNLERKVIRQQLLYRAELNNIKDLLLFIQNLISENIILDSDIFHSIIRALSSNTANTSNNNNNYNNNNNTANNYKNKQ